MQSCPLAGSVTWRKNQKQKNIGVFVVAGIKKFLLIVVVMVGFAGCGRERTVTPALLQLRLQEAVGEMDISQINASIDALLEYDGEWPGQSRSHPALPENIWPSIITVFREHSVEFPQLPDFDMFIVFNEMYRKLSQLTNIDLEIYDAKNIRPIWGTSVSYSEFTDVIATAPNGKIIVCHENERNSLSVDFGLTAMLPERFIPTELAEVEYIVLINYTRERDGNLWQEVQQHTNFPAGRGYFGYRWIVEVNLHCASDMSLLRNLQTLTGRDSTSSSPVVNNRMMGAGPASTEFAAVLRRISP
jgi:hypothetical protein